MTNLNPLTQTGKKANNSPTPIAPIGGQKTIYTDRVQGLNQVGSTYKSEICKMFVVICCDTTF